MKFIKKLIVTVNTCIYTQFMIYMYDDKQGLRKTKVFSHLPMFPFSRHNQTIATVENAFYTKHIEGY